MMAPGSEIFVAWVIVAVAGLGTLAGIFVLTRRIPVLWLRSLLRCLAAVWLLLPSKIQVVVGYYAPAFVVLIFEGLFRQDGDPGPAMRVLLAGTLVVVAVFLAVGTWQWQRGRRTAGPAEPVDV